MNNSRKPTNKVWKLNRKATHESEGPPNHKVSSVSVAASLKTNGSVLGKRKAESELALEVAVSAAKVRPPKTSAGAEAVRSKAPGKANELNAAFKAAKVEKTKSRGAANGIRTISSEAQEPTPEECAKYVGLDCEMVGVGKDGKDSALAQCCVVDWHGRTIYNAYVRPPERVTDFRTFVSGVKAAHLKSNRAVTLKQCQDTVAPLLQGKILVGHSLSNDLSALMLSHPRNMIRDTATYRPFKRSNKRGKLAPRSLKKLTLEFLNREIQSGEHDPAEDAIAALDLYKLKRREWEASLREGKGGKRGIAKPVRQDIQLSSTVDGASSNKSGSKPGRRRL